MADSKARKMSPELIATLSKYEDRFRRALRGDRVELSSQGEKELAQAFKEIFGHSQSMRQCCGGSRKTADRIAPIAKAYFSQINGTAKNTTGLQESIEETTAQNSFDNVDKAQESLEIEKVNIDTPKKTKPVKTSKNG